MIRAAAILVPALLALHGCISTARPPTPRQSGPVPSWLGCYVIERTDSGQVIDSLEILRDSPTPDTQRSGFRPTFYHESFAIIDFGNSAFTGPAWRLRGDTLVIAEGALSGWTIKARRSRAGFEGWYVGFTDLIGERVAECLIAGIRVPCPSKRAT
jgi:hypothetical protein